MVVAVILQGAFNIYRASDAIESVVTFELDDQIGNIEREILSAKETIQITKDAINEKNIALTRSVAQVIAIDPTWLETSKMEELAALLGVPELHVTDGEGVLLYGNVPGFYGFDFKTTDQTKPFVDLIGNKNASLAQEPSLRGTDATLFQYIGVPRLDQPGIVQIGLEPKAIQDLLEKLDIQKTLEKLVIGDGGYGLIVDASGVIVKHADAALVGKATTEVPWIAEVIKNPGNLMTITDNGNSMYAIAKQDAERTIIVTYPRTNITSIIRSIMISNIAIIIVTIVLLILIIQQIIGKWVSKPLKLIQQGMDEVGNGNFTTHVTYKSKDEIGVLANDFEKMTANIQHLIHETANRIHSVASSSELIHHNVEGLSSTTHEVTLAVEEIAHGSTEMASNVNERLVTGHALGTSISEIFVKLGEAKTVSDQMVTAN